MYNQKKKIMLTVPTNISVRDMKKSYFFLCDDESQYLYNEKLKICLYLGNFSNQTEGLEHYEKVTISVTDESGYNEEQTGILLPYNEANCVPDVEALARGYINWIYPEEQRVPNKEILKLWESQKDFLECLYQEIVMDIFISDEEMVHKRHEGLGISYNESDDEFFITDVKYNAISFVQYRTEDDPLLYFEEFYQWGIESLQGYNEEEE